MSRRKLSASELRTETISIRLTEAEAKNLLEYKFAHETVPMQWSVFARSLLLQAIKQAGLQATPTVQG